MVIITHFIIIITRDNRILSRKKHIQQVEQAPRKLITVLDLSPTCNMFLDLSDLSNLLIVRFVKFKSPRILSEKVACMEL